MKRILVVDDELDFLDTVRAVLEMQGYGIECCGNGQEAMAKLGDGAPPPDLLLLDVMMPVRDGMWVLGQLADTPRLGSLPVIVMSAVAPPRPMPNATRFLPKPFSIDALVQAVSETIGAP